MSEAERFNPYPGLRPFEKAEAYLFFGREGSVAQMMERLRRNRFLAVTGPSGCGKSSLVRAGLLHALDLGGMGPGKENFKVVLFRPGSEPLWELSRALVRALPEATTQSASPSAEEIEIAAGVTRAVLERSPGALVDWIERLKLPPDRPILILVDQFEEIFRYGRKDADQKSNLEHREEIERFVGLLLESVRSPSQPEIYCVISMRLDFMADCAQFVGLAEAINDGQFLTPRLTRDACRDAIAEPARVAGGSIADPLVARLLNNMAAEDLREDRALGANPDLLPLLQHVLSMMWDRESAQHGGTPPHLTLDDYEELGGLSGALSAHASGVFDALKDELKPLAERLFRALSQPSAGQQGRDVRRPLKAADAALETGATIAQLAEIVKAFGGEGRNFLVAPLPLMPETVIDISHEALIRQWVRLQEWVREEQRAGDEYRDILRRALRWESGAEDYLAELASARAHRWWTERNPTEGWTTRYGGHFDLVRRYVTESRAYHEEQARKRDQAERVRLEEQARQVVQRRVTRILGGAAGVTFLFALAAAAMWYLSYNRARDALDWQAEYLAKRSGEIARQAQAAGNDPDLLKLALRTAYAAVESAPPNRLSAQSAKPNLLSILESMRWAGTRIGHPTVGATKFYPIAGTSDFFVVAGRPEASATERERTLTEDMDAVPKTPPGMQFVGASATTVDTNLYGVAEVDDDDEIDDVLSDLVENDASVFLSWHGTPVLLLEHDVDLRVCPRTETTFTCTSSWDPFHDDDDQYLTAVAASDDGALIAFGGDNGEIRIHDTSGPFGRLLEGEEVADDLATYRPALSIPCRQADANDCREISSLRLGATATRGEYTLLAMVDGGTASVWRLVRTPAGMLQISWRDDFGSDEHQVSAIALAPGAEAVAMQKEDQDDTDRLYILHFPTGPARETDALYRADCGVEGDAPIHAAACFSALQGNTVERIRFSPSANIVITAGDWVDLFDGRSASYYATAPLRGADAMLFEDEVGEPLRLVIAAAGGLQTLEKNRFAPTAHTDLCASFTPRARDGRAPRMAYFLSGHDAGNPNLLPRECRGDEGGFGRIVDLDTASVSANLQRLTAGGESVERAAMAGGNIVAAVDKEGMLHIWDQSGMLRVSRPAGADVVSLAVSDNDRVATLARNGEIAVYAVAPNFEVTEIARRTIAEVADAADSDTASTINLSPDGERVTVLRGAEAPFSGPAEGLMLAPMAALSEENFAEHLAAGEALATPHVRNVYFANIAMSFHDTTVAGTHAVRLVVTDLARDQVLCIGPRDAEAADNAAMSAVPIRGRFAYARETKIVIYDLTHENCRQPLRIIETERRINALRLTQNGRYAIANLTDGSVSVFDVPTGRMVAELASWPMLSNYFMDSSASRLSVVAERSIRVYEFPYLDFVAEAEADPDTLEAWVREALGPDQPLELSENELDSLRENEFVSGETE